MSKIDKNIVELYYYRCNCGNLISLGDSIEILSKVHCPFCKQSSIILDINSDQIIKHNIEEKEINLISFEEAIEINYVNPGTVLYSYDKRNWIFADSNPTLWSDFTKEHPLYFTTLSFK